MNTRGLHEIKLTDVSAGSPALTEPEKVRCREVVERFKRAHRVKEVDLEDAVQWSVLRGDLQLTREDVKRYNTSLLNEALLPLLQGDSVSLGQVAGALRSLRGTDQATPAAVPRGKRSAGKSARESGEKGKGSRKGKEE